VFFYRTHLQDLKETTAQAYYELYRHKRLEALKEVPLDSVPDSPVPTSSGVNFENGMRVNSSRPSNKSTGIKAAKGATPPKKPPTAPNHMINSAEKSQPIAESNI